MLPAEALVMPPELEAVDVLLVNPRFFDPFRRWFDPMFGPPSIPMETYLRGPDLAFRPRLHQVWGNGAPKLHQGLRTEGGTFR